MGCQAKSQEQRETSKGKGERRRIFVVRYSFDGKSRCINGCAIHILNAGTVGQPVVAVAWKIVLGVGVCK